MTPISIGMVIDHHSCPNSCIKDFMRVNERLYILRIETNKNSKTDNVRKGISNNKGKGRYITIENINRRILKLIYVKSR
jgi:hypothetical protein